jgi:hypothetical protein
MTAIPLASQDEKPLYYRIITNIEGLLPIEPKKCSGSIREATDCTIYEGFHLFVVDLNK